MTRTRFLAYSCNKPFIRYVLVGLLNTVLGISLFLFLSNYTSQIISSILVEIVVISYRFLFYRFFVFPGNFTLTHLAPYLGNSIMLAFLTVLLVSFVSTFSAPLVTSLITVPIMAVLGFLLNRLIFR